ncbi:nucleotide binding protein [Trema orientale]|uniref:Nucleotide binding protein n=1 Tax=Trema orientale TaxID=63057 RepID=A0A2P5ELK7_TREOI|nr:nucleotide binding protein [Trema orientale]
MDVFIPEEYVMRRRMERKAASSGNGRKSTNTSTITSTSTSSKKASDSGCCNFEKEKNKARQPSFGGDQNKFLVSSGVLSDNNIVFTCFSA